MGTTVDQLKQVIEQEYSTLVRFFGQKLNDRTYANDLANDTVVKALDFCTRNPEYLPDSWKHWLWRIARNIWVDQVRSETRDKKHCLYLEQPLHSSDGLAANSEGDGHNEPYTSPDFADEIQSKIVEHEVHSAIRKVKGDKQKAIILFHLEECSRDVVAKQLYPEQEDRQLHSQISQIGGLLRRGRQDMKYILSTPSILRQLEI